MSTRRKKNRRRRMGIGFPSVLSSKCYDTHILGEKSTEKISMYYCGNFPRILYMIRSCPCFLAPEALRNIDASLRQFLTETLNVQLDDKAWTG